MEKFNVKIYPETEVLSLLKKIGVNGVNFTIKFKELSESSQKNIKDKYTKYSLLLETIISEIMIKYPEIILENTKTLLENRYKGVNFNILRENKNFSLMIKPENIVKDIISNKLIDIKKLVENVEKETLRISSYLGKHIEYSLVDETEEEIIVEDILNEFIDTFTEKSRKNIEKLKFVLEETMKEFKETNKFLDNKVDEETGLMKTEYNIIEDMTSKVEEVVNKLKQGIGDNPNLLPPKQEININKNNKGKK